MMMTQGKGNDNDDAGGLSTKHLRFHDDTHDDDDIEGKIDELYTNVFIGLSTFKIIIMSMLKTYRVSIHLEFPMAEFVSSNLKSNFNCPPTDFSVQFG